MRPLPSACARGAESFANTGALKKAVEKRNRRANGRVAVTIVEAFGGDDAAPRDLEATLQAAQPKVGAGASEEPT